MCRSDFNNVMKRLQSVDGKKFFEEYLQYMGWFFLNLTDKQVSKLFVVVSTFGYPTIERNNNTWLVCPNGLQICKF